MRLARRVEKMAAAVVAPLPPERRIWVDGALAEADCVPAGRRRLRWALGALRMAVWKPITVGPVDEAGSACLTRRMFVLLGLVPVGMYMVIAVQSLSDDAPDGTHRSNVALLVAQSFLGAALVGSWWRWRPAIRVLLPAVAVVMVEAVFSAVDNGGPWWLAPFVLGLPSGVPAGWIAWSLGSSGWERRTGEREAG